jgi:transposase-like zinc ribbon protein
MNILEFTRRFPTEKSCRNYLKEVRQENGIKCKTCNIETDHYWLENIEKFQCSICKSRTNLRHGTLMEKSKVPVRTWFMCIHLMTTTVTFPVFEAFPFLRHC